jgi:superfamily I DNA/RNA helicase
MPNFRFRLPIDSQLTDAQRIALNNDNSILIYGGPGSGKTVVTINRFLIPVKNKKDVMLFTYNRTLLASIKGLLTEKSEELFGTLDKHAIGNVINNKVASFYKWYGWFQPDFDDAKVAEDFKGKLRRRGGLKFSEIFFDEAQDLTSSVFANAFILADKVSCGADNAQNLQGNFPPDEAVDIIFAELKKQSYTELQQLEANFRNTKEIFEFARGFVPEDLAVQELDTTQLDPGENPEIVSALNLDQQKEYIKRVIENNPNSNIGILVNYANQVMEIKEYLENNGYSCKADASEDKSFSYYCSTMPQDDEQVMFEQMKTPFIVTYDSCKGLEFDIVIMPFFNDAQAALSKPRKRKVGEEWIIEKNADGTPKMLATINHYYVGATRAKTTLYVLCNSKPSILNFYKPVIAVDNDLPF